MNDTARLSPDVAAFAAAVRERLSDLDADEVEELTGDLEADLQERVDDAGTADLGDPAAYATELRTAAGLPPRDVRRPRQPWHRTIAAAVSGRIHRLEERLRAHAASSSALDFFIALRPIWWILRAWVAYEIAHLFFASNSPGSFVPHSLQAWLVFIAAVVVSVQWGRGRWRDRRWIPALVVVGSIVAVIGLPVAYEHASDRSTASVRTWARPVAHQPDGGLRMNGRAVRNVFAYDTRGNPLTDVQLYDQRGKPLFVTRRQTWNWVSVPATLRTGQQAWNVFPLARVKWRDSKFDRAIGDRVAEPGVVPQVWDLPMPHAPAIMATPTDGGTADKDDSGERAQGSDSENDKQKPPDNAQGGQN